MRRTLLISVAALALAVGGQAAFSQGGGGAGGGTGASGSGGGTGGTINQSPSGGGAGSAGTTGGASTGQSGATTAPSAQTDTQKGQPSRQQQGQAPGNDGSKGTTGTPTTKQGASEGTSTTRQGAAGTSTSSHVSLNAEQKTRIRQTVLTSSAPRVSTVNFDVRVGTVVPRSVHIVELPPTLVEIEPQWRGYRYFVYHDEIVIIEPDTLRIVAVLQV